MNNKWLEHLKNFNAMLDDLTMAGVLAPGYEKVLKALRSHIIKQAEKLL